MPIYWQKQDVHQSCGKAVVKWCYIDERQVGQACSPGLLVILIIRHIIAENGTRGGGLGRDALRVVELLELASRCCCWGCCIRRLVASAQSVVRNVAGRPRV